MSTEDVNTNTQKHEETNAEHHHDENCQHDHEEKKGAKGEKKVRKALGKLGMTKVEGVNRVTIRQKDNYILVVKEPEVYSSPQTENTFIVFGELTFEDPEKKLAQEQIENLKKEGEKLATTAETNAKDQIEVIDENEEVSEEGLDPASIETVMNEVKCSRQKAVKTLRKHNGDTIETILELQ